MAYALRDGDEDFEMTLIYGSRKEEDILFRKELDDIDAACNEPILVAVERAGIKAPSRCRSGECGWCRSKMVKGDVFTPTENEFRRFEDKELGYIHPCCTFALTDAEIEVPGEFF